MCLSPNKIDGPIVKTRPTASKNRFRNVLIIALALTFSVTPQPTEAAWVLGYKVITKVIKIIKRIDVDDKKYRKVDDKKYRKVDRKDRDKSDEDEEPNSNSPRDTGGPVVQTGPTAGENRTRNKDGQWRRKRSDAGKKRK